MPREFSFCPKCGSGLDQRAIHGHGRPLCPDASLVFWQSPAVEVAVIPENHGRRTLPRP